LARLLSSSIFYEKNLQNKTKLSLSCGTKKNTTLHAQPASTENLASPSATVQQGRSLLPKIPRFDEAAAPKASTVARAVANVDFTATGAKVLPQFLANKPLDVTLYTPELLKMFRASHAASAAISTLGSMRHQFEGDYLAFSTAAATSAPATAMECRSRKQAAPPSGRSSSSAAAVPHGAYGALRRHEQHEVS
jgi:hypothetical protein